MKIAFCLLNYFAYGGLQRDFMRIAKECVRRGHEVHVYTSRWDGEREPDFHLHLVKVRGVTNHARARCFSDQVSHIKESGQFDLVVGFNKMPGLDLYYAADVCYQARIKAKRGILYRLLPRYRAWRDLEAAVFARGAATEILLIAPTQQEAYSDCYGTEARRFHVLPPGINRDRLAPDNAAEIRARMRNALGLSEPTRMLLMVGSGFKTKGLDRAIAGLAALPALVRERTQLYVVGQGDAAPFLKQARQLGVEDQVHIMGARADVPEFLLAADLLLQPSYHENTGTVLLEALAAGLPVLTTAVCGYAHYINDAHAGVVLAARFDQQAWNGALESMLVASGLKEYGENGLRFAKTADIYSMPERAVDLIEQKAKKVDVS